MRIECTTTFLHGADRFEQGDIRSVPDELGAYFIAQGWANNPGELPSADVTLDVHNSIHASEVTHG